ncbi:hypothetical protein BD408DRAFT_363593 [Parasitella parasitica]|nr:hypothetical protein BD408DRAFT_363593 [Parasitella parasitica]
MKSTFDNRHHQKYTNDNVEQNCCCCCYCCCCAEYQLQQQPEQQKSTSSGSRSNQRIPPWFPSTTNSSMKPTMESACSCCSCISNEEEDDEEEDEVSTRCTTPIDLNIQTTDNIDKLRKKKLHAIEELLQTERDYVQDLSYLVQIFFDVLSRQQWITPDHKSIIIQNSHEILSFHKQFIISYDTLSVCDFNWSCIAKAFLDQIGQFSLYKHYCDLHAEAWALTSEYRDRPEWACFLKDCTIKDSYSIPLNLNILATAAAAEEQQQQQKKLHFEDYLIKPVQRICRYQLLIKEIVRYTSPQTAEYDLWSSALSELQEIVNDIDDMKLQREMKERTERFIERLDDDWRINKRHVSQLGSLLIAGAIEITYSALGQSVSKPRYLGCFIFQTYIILVRPKKVNSYEPKHWFPLRMADFEDLGDIEGQQEHSFVVRCKKHTFAFSASCSQEKQLWVKKIQEAIVTAKIEASDENLSAQDFIVSSLPGITSKRSPQSIRLSRSFTNILDMTLAGTTDINDQTMSSPDRKTLRRSASTSIQFEDIMKMTRPTHLQQATPLLPIVTKSSDVKLKKRYSADYSSAYYSNNNGNRQTHGGFALKSRNHSEMYIKPDALGSKRRPSSLDLLSAANNTSNMIGKMSFQLKNSHQNALRVTVDHKLRDVCTQEFLSSRAWHMRDRDQNFQSSFDLTSVAADTNSGGNSPVVGDSNDLLKKRKSSSFMRSPASSFSLIIPKRASDSRQSNSRLQLQQGQEDSQSINSSSCASSIDRCISPMTKNSASSRRPSQSSQLLRQISQNRGRFPESPQSYSSEYSFSNSQKRLERSPSRKQIFVGKVLRRIASLHHKSPSPSFEHEFNEVKKSASVDTRSKIKWTRQKHEELNHSKVSDRSYTITINENKEKHNEEDNEEEEEEGHQEPQTTLTAFVYASTPPPVLRRHQQQKDAKWKHRLSLMRPASFLNLKNNSATTIIN